MAKSKIAYVFLALAILLWGTTPAVAKLLVKNLDNFQVMFYTFVIALMALFIVAALQKKLAMIKKLRLKDYLRFLSIGGIGIFFYYIFYYWAFMLLPAQEVTVINYLWPIMIIIFASIILKEKFTSLKVAGIIISFIGVYIVITHGDIFHFNTTSILGIFFAFLAGLSYGLFSVLGKKYEYDRTISMLFYFLFSLILSIVTLFLFSKPVFPPLPELGGLLWLGVMTGAIAHLVWFLALKHGETAKMSNLIYLTPFAGLVFIYFLVGEKILWSSIVGLLIIIAGICLQFFQNVQNKKKNKINSKKN